MNNETVQEILQRGGINPNVFHDVRVSTENGRVVKRNVTALGLSTHSMVSRLDRAILAGCTDINDILTFTGDQPQVYLRRVTAPNRKSEINTETLLRSWTVHVNFLAGSASHSNSFVKQFCKCFGADKVETASELQKYFRAFKKDSWDPGVRKYLTELRQAILEAGDTLPKEPEVEKRVCQGTTKAGNPCKAFAVSGSDYCATHTKQASN